MGYTLQPYAVRLIVLTECVGTKDAQLIKTLKEKNQAESDRNATWFSDAIDDGCPSLTQAIERLVNGDPLGDDFGFQYGYATVALLDHFGRRLANDWLWLRLDELDATLDHLKLGFIYEELFRSGPPISMPVIDDFPGIGFMTRDNARRAAELLSRLGPAQLEPYAMYNALHVKDTLDGLRRVLEDAVGTRDDVVFVYS